MNKLPIVDACLDCRPVKTKDEKGKPIIVQAPCTKIKDKECELYANPELMWKKTGGCIFPNSALTIKEMDKQNYRKHRNR